MKNREIAKVVEKAQRGDSLAIKELYDNTVNIVFKFCNNYLGNSLDAEDATQEVFLRVYGNIEKLKQPEAFNKWLSTIMSAVCSTYKSKNNKILTTDLEMDMLPNQFVEENKDFLPVESLEQSEVKIKLEEVISLLPEKQKEVVLYYYYQDLSVREISEITGRSVNSILNVLYEARKKIKKAVEELNKKDKSSGLPKFMFGLAPIFKIQIKKGTDNISAAAKDEIWKRVLTKGNLEIPVLATVAGAGALSPIMLAVFAVGVIATATSVYTIKNNMDINEMALQANSNIMAETSEYIEQSKVNDETSILELGDENLLDLFKQVNSLAEFEAFCDTYSFQKNAGFNKDGKQRYLFAVMFREDDSTLLIGIKDTGGSVTKAYEEGKNLSIPSDMVDWFELANQI